jgi:hypothetical protein
MPMAKSPIVKMEERTARLTVLIDPRKKAVFERLCAEQDLTPSQVVRQMIRSYIEQKTGRPWTPTEHPVPTPDSGASPSRRRRPRS